MKRNFVYVLTMIALVGVLFACQKEMSLELPVTNAVSAGSLKSGAGDTCLPKTVKGLYKTGVFLGDSNFIEVAVDVTTVGTYTIRTDTINGFSFKGTGTFATAGLNTVKLLGTGKPVTAGVTPFVVKYDTSDCIVPVTVIAGTAPPPTASCTPVLSGRYVKDTTLNASNTVKFSHSYSAPGVYTLRSDTINGYYFTGTYTAAAAGVQNVILTGAGTPLALGINNFTVRFGDGTTCPLAITVTAGIVPPPPGCSAAIVQGTYTVGSALTAANKVDIQHTYATVGTFNVTTTTFNGYSFSKTVNVTTAGIPITVSMAGTGTPLAAGINNFMVNFGDGSTNCPFSVTVVAGTTPATGVYFPLTHNSFWTYKVFEPLTALTDSVKRSILDSTMRAGNMFKVFVEQNLTALDTSHFFFRRSGNDYFEHNYVDWYSDFEFNESVYGDILFLKEAVTTNQSWESATWMGTQVGTTTVKRMKYWFVCLNANTTATVNGMSFSNVYKIKFKAQTAPGTTGGSFTDDAFYWEALYARGVGLIEIKGFDAATSVSFYERSIKNYTVN